MENSTQVMETKPVTDDLMEELLGDLDLQALPTCHHPLADNGL